MEVPAIAVTADAGRIRLNVYLNKLGIKSRPVQMSSKRTTIRPRDHSLATDASFLDPDDA